MTKLIYLLINHVYFYSYKRNWALNYLRWLICLKTHQTKKTNQPNQPTYTHIYSYKNFNNIHMHLAQSAEVVENPGW